MQSGSQKIVPCLWFDDQAEDAAKFYISIFPDSKVKKVARYPQAGREVHGRPPGSAMTVEFELNGQTFTALNGGPHFRFNEAVSLQVFCQSQEEIDDYWEKLSDGGDENAQMCGWLKDKYGFSWQIVPAVLGELMSDAARAERVMAVLLKMKKLDIEKLEAA